MSNDPTCPAAKRELTELLTQIRLNRATIYATKESWDECYAGDCEFSIVENENWKIVVFNDADSYDYISEVYTPTNHYIDYPWADECVALSGMSNSEFEKILRAAQPKWTLDEINDVKIDQETRFPAQTGGDVQPRDTTTVHDTAHNKEDSHFLLILA